MAYPYRKTYKRFEKQEEFGNSPGPEDMTPKRPDYSNTSIGYNHFRGYKSSYDPVSPITSAKFVGGFVLIITIIVLFSWLKARWQEKKYIKDWDKKKHERELEAREKNSASSGVSAFGYEGNAHHGGKKMSTTTKSSIANEYTTLNTPGELDVEVCTARGKTISGKRIRSKVQLLELTRVLGLKFPEDCVITIKTKMKKTGDEKDV